MAPAIPKAARARLSAELAQLSIADRLRLAANLIDDAHAERAEPRALCQRALAILQLVDKQITDMLVKDYGRRYIGD